jgi:N-acyl-D-amino-acid deacylase
LPSIIASLWGIDMHSKRWWLFIVWALILFAVIVTGWFWLYPYRNLDLLIVNGMVVDGMGGTPRICDVGIRDGKIVGIGKWIFFFSRPNVRIDAQGRIVAPGFIDVHTHVELNLPASGPFRCPNFLRQGVTTLITGNCGRSRTNIQTLFSNLEKGGSYINFATLIGHNSIRQEVVGSASRSPTPAELARMQRLVERAMQDGALGLSTGLAYTPGRFAQPAEIIALAKTAAEHGGLYVSHIRDEGSKGMQAIQEALEIGRLSGARVHISHFKSSGPSQWNTTSQRLGLLDDARMKGQQVTIDVYPYDRSSTTTDVLLPDWAIKDNRTDLQRIARDTQLREQLHKDILTGLRQNGWKDLTHISLASGRQEWVGRTLAQVPMIAPDLDHQIGNLIDVSVKGGAQAIYADMEETSVSQVMTYKYVTFGSDSAVRDPNPSYKPHPRGCGTFPRIFRYYVREKNVLELSEAVYKATGQAAEIFGLENRGCIRAGAWADIAVFDLEKIEDRADYDQPFAEPYGIDYVIVNGTITVDHGTLTNNGASGMVLRRMKARSDQSLLDSYSE